MKARRISDGMLMAAARALAAVSPARHDSNANLLPSVDVLREVSLQVGEQVDRQAIREALTDCPATLDVAAAVRQKMWRAEYVPT